MLSSSTRDCGSAEAWGARLVDVEKSIVAVCISSLSRDWVTEGAADMMVAKVVGVEMFIAAGCRKDAGTRGAARPKTKRRWLRVCCILYSFTPGLMSSRCLFRVLD